LSYVQENLATNHGNYLLLTNRHLGFISSNFRSKTA